MARRRRGGDGLTIIYWRDIPAQVTGSADGATAKALLEPRFQHAIDRAATVADLTETSAYVAQWRRVTEPLQGDPETVVEATVKALADGYPRERLERLVATGGAEEADRGRPEREEESKR